MSMSTNFVFLDLVNSSKLVTSWAELHSSLLHIKKILVIIYCTIYIVKPVDLPLKHVITLLFQIFWKL